MGKLYEKKIMGWIIILVVIAAAFITFTKHGTLRGSKKTREVVMKIQDKEEIPVTAFGGRLKLPVSAYYFYINIDDVAMKIDNERHAVRVSKNDYENSRKSGAFEISFINIERHWEVSRVKYKGIPSKYVKAKKEEDKECRATSEKNRTDTPPSHQEKKNERTVIEKMTETIREKIKSTGK